MVWKPTGSMVELKENSCNTKNKKSNAMDKGVLYFVKQILYPFNAMVDKYLKNCTSNDRVLNLYDKLYKITNSAN